MRADEPGGRLAMLRFEADKKQTAILDTRAGGERKSIPSEVRRDPLTGRTARICHFMELKWQKPDLLKLAEGTQSWCPFCPENVLRVTPLFPVEIVAEGRLTRGDMVLFPNLAPYDSLSAVATFGDRHVTPMTEFTPTRIAQAFGLAQDFFRRVDAAGHPESVYHLVNWNHMPPAGSSLIHSHLQVFASSHAPNLLAQELSAASRYLEENGRVFWDDLLAHERAEGTRYLAAIGRAHFMQSYAPMGVAGDVLAILEGVSSTLELTDDDLLAIGEGLCATMKAYDSLGVYGFNMNYFPGRKGDRHARFHILFSPRTFFNQALGTTDVGALRNLYNESICMAYPEEIAGKLRPFFAHGEPNRP
jgi:galactose-1-phosphate uridylyltransferase